MIDLTERLFNLLREFKDNEEFLKLKREEENIIKELNFNRSNCISSDPYEQQKYLEICHKIEEERQRLKRLDKELDLSSVIRYIDLERQILKTHIKIDVLERSLEKFFTKSKSTSNLCERKEEVSRKIRWFTERINYLKASLELRGKELKVVKSEGYYSLRVESGLRTVFLNEGHFLKYLKTTRKDKPLEIEAVQKNVYQEEVVDMINKSFGIDLNGLFVTERLLILPDDKMQEIASDIYQQVLTGENILPAPEEPGSYKLASSNGSSKKSPDDARFRKWSQRFLEDLNPEKIIRGKILGSGGSYGAFVFNKCVVVEFDQEDRATYIFDLDYFESLKVFERSKILIESPKGFKGRIIHHREGKEAWKKKVLLCLS